METEAIKRKYVDIEGRAAISIEAVDGKPRLKLTFLNDELKPIPSFAPLFFYREDPATGIPMIVLKNAHIIAEFSKTGFNTHQDMLKAFDPLLKEWNKLEDSDNSLSMNTTDPPTT